VDDEIRAIIETAQTKAATLLKKYRKQLDAVSQRLLEVETLDGDEFTKVMGIPKVKKSVKKAK